MPNEKPRPFSVRKKLSICKRHANEGKTYADLGKEHGVSAATIRSWVKAFVADGVLNKDTITARKAYIRISKDNRLLSKSTHFSRTYSVSKQLAICNRYVNAEESYVDLGKEYGVSAKKIRSWVKAFVADGKLSKHDLLERKKAIEARKTEHTRDQRLRLFQKYIDSGMCGTDFCEKFGCSPHHLYLATAMHKSEGLIPRVNLNGRNIQSQIDEDLAIYRRMKEDGLTQVEVAAEIGVTQGTIARRMKSLRKRGLIDRIQNDKSCRAAKKEKLG